MNNGQFWLVLFIGLVVVSAVVTALVKEGRHGLGCLATPLAASLAVTAYVVLFERDPQALVFLFMFYGMATVAAGTGALVGYGVRKLWQ